jgi:hypothetical protein
LWVYLGDAAHPYNVFDFTPTRQRDGPQRFLTGFQGYLHADAFSGYDRLYLPERRPGHGAIVEVACNAHARRKFYEARSSDSVRAHQVLGYYRQLYALERGTADFVEQGRYQVRQDFAVPILAQFHAWMQAQRADVLPKSPMGEAPTYALNQWAALCRFTEQGFLTIDNNAAERLARLTDPRRSSHAPAPGSVSSPGPSRLVTATRFAERTRKTTDSLSNGLTTQLQSLCFNVAQHLFEQKRVRTMAGQDGAASRRSSHAHGCSLSRGTFPLHHNSAARSKIAP